MDADPPAYGVNFACRITPKLGLAPIRKHPAPAWAGAVDLRDKRRGLGRNG